MKTMTEERQPGPAALISPPIAALEKLLLSSDALGRLSRYEAHLFREIRMTLRDLDAARRARAAPPKPAHGAQAAGVDTHDRILQSMAGRPFNPNPHDR